MHTLSSLDTQNRHSISHTRCTEPRPHCHLPQAMRRTAIRIRDATDQLTLSHSRSVGIAIAWPESRVIASTTDQMPVGDIGDLKTSLWFVECTESTRIECNSTSYTWHTNTNFSGKWCDGPTGNCDRNCACCGHLASVHSCIVLSVPSRFRPCEHNKIRKRIECSLGLATLTYYSGGCTMLLCIQPSV